MITKKNIILLDVDAVLIHALGYRASARGALEYIARQMGQRHIIGPQEDDMLVFESKSIIFEWDSLAICTATLLSQAQDYMADTFADSLARIAASGMILQQPDYAEIARQCPIPDGRHTNAAALTLGTLFSNIPAFIELLGQTHTITAPMTQIFQHFVLGDEQYGRTYGLRPLFETPSLLQALDRPLLTPETHQRLMEDPALLPVIYTARPSLPPSFVSDWHGYSPEAEIAQRLLNFFDIPLIAYGRMQWLAKEVGQPSHSFVKPSPVQGLAAIYSAVLQGSENWEDRALRLAATDAPPPNEMRGIEWQIVVCEDSPASIRGVRAAVEQLSRHLPISVIGVGVAHTPENAETLGQVADYVVSDVNAGLAQALGWT